MVSFSHPFRRRSSDAPARDRGVRIPVDPPVTVVLPEPLAGEVRVLLAADRRVDAVRLTRERTGLGLLIATKAVDAVGRTDPADAVGVAPDLTSRVLDADGRQVTVGVGTPEPEGEDWFCSYRVTGLPSGDVEGRAGGVDGVQALIGALTCVGDAVDQHGGVTWLGEVHLGLPITSYEESAGLLLATATQRVHPSQA